MFPKRLLDNLISICCNICFVIRINEQAILQFPSTDIDLRGNVHLTLLQIFFNFSGIFFNFRCKCSFRQICFIQIEMFLFRQISFNFFLSLIFLIGYFLERHKPEYLFGFLGVPRRHEITILNLTRRQRYLLLTTCTFR